MEERKGSLDHIISGLLEEVTGTPIVVSRSFQLNDAVVTADPEVLDPQVRLLSPRNHLVEIRDKVYPACHAAERLESGHLSIRSDHNRQHGELVITEDSVSSILVQEDQTLAMTTADASFTDRLYSFYTRIWNKAETFPMRTPGISKIQETSEREFGVEFKADIADAIRTTKTTYDDGSLNLAEISILVGAKHEELLYDLSSWGERIGLASSATFSRMKTSLEDQRVITTEKVPVDVGRPRMRLKLSDPGMRDRSIGEIIQHAGTLE